MDLFHDYETQWFSSGEQSVPPREHLATSGDIFGHHNWGSGECYLNLMGRDQGGCYAFCNAQENPQQQRIVRTTKSIVLRVGDSEQRIKSKFVYLPNEIFLPFFLPLLSHRILTCRGRDTSGKHMCFSWSSAPFGCFRCFPVCHILHRLFSSSSSCLHLFVFPTFPKTFALGKPDFTSSREPC